MGEQNRFKKVRYKKLNGRQKEIFNFQKLAATLAEYGFNCIKLADDWQQADFLAYHIDGTTSLRVQLKSRIGIHKKYRKKNLWIAFPHQGCWYLIEHDILIAKVGLHTDWLTTVAWRKGRAYTSESINPRLLKSLSENKLGPVYGAVLK